MPQTQSDQVFRALTAAADAAESVRSFNHITIELGPSMSAGATYPMVGELRSTVERMPQALHQVGNGLRQRNRDVVLRHDEGADVNATVESIVKELDEAADRTEDAARAIERAQALLGHLADTGEQRPQ